MNLFRRSMKEVIKIVIKCKFMKLWGNIVYLVNDLNPDLAEIMRRDRCVCGLVMRAGSSETGEWRAGPRPEHGYIHNR